MSTSEGPAAVTDTPGVSSGRPLASRTPRRPAVGSSHQLTALRTRRRQLQQHLRTSRAMRRLARAHFEVAACDMLLPPAAALAALPASQSGQSPPVADLVRAVSDRTAPISLHTLSTLLQHLERYESDLSEEMAELTDDLVLLLQGDPGSCLPEARSA